MPGNIVSTVVKLLIASLIVGFVLSTLDITPMELFHELGGTVRETLDAAGDFFGWALQYIVLSAFVVVPIWLLIVGTNLIRKR